MAQPPPSDAHAEDGGFLPLRLVRRATNTDLAFGSLPAIRELRAQLDELEDRAVASARDKGASWGDIADALGITRQALQQRIARRALARARRDAGT